MAFLRLNNKLPFFIQVIIIHVLPKHTSRAAVTNNCTSAVYSTDACNKITYEQVYNILAKSENSFNIESALYPAKRPSSVRVFVNVYGPNKTENSTPAAKYTWSISCLYAAVPAKVLQFWSLWSIMVTTRTQELNITISLSCCDVTKGKLKQYIEDALAALQDLAVLPGLRDPQLNSAECIIEGHQPNISSTTEHSWRLISILVLSFFFSTLFGPLLAFYVTQRRDELSLIKKNTIDFLCGFLLLIFGGLLIAMLCREREVVHPFIEAIQLVTIVVGILVFLVAYYKCKGETNNQSVKKKSCVFIICANLAAYHFCWLLVGIMLNPIWGLVVLLLVCLVIGVSTFAFHTFLSSTTSDKCQPFSSCFAGFLAVCCLIVVVIFAGQSYSGRETADEALKEAVMYLISIFFSWLYWKKWVKKSDECGDSGSRSDQAILSQNGQASEHQV